MSQVQPLFCVPLYISNLNPGDLVGVFDFAKSLSYNHFKEGAVDYTMDPYIIDKLPKFKNAIVNKVNDYFFNYLTLDPLISFYFPDSWFTKCTPEASGKKHCHVNSLFSGVVYIDAEDTSNITFFHPSQHHGGTIGISKTLLNYREFNILNSESWEEVPENGKIIIFPSFLEHEINKNYSNKDRYSFAFNILIENYKCNIVTARVLDR
jgi:hypothetical protein